jgi:hypothetical protein
MDAVKVHRFVRKIGHSAATILGVKHGNTFYTLGIFQQRYVKRHEMGRHWHSPVLFEAAKRFFPNRRCSRRDLDYVAQQLGFQPESIE